MASILEQFDRVPIWQRIVATLLVGGMIGGVWYFFFFDEALEAQRSAKQTLAKAETELVRVKDEKERFLERQRRQVELEEELERKMQVLPMTTASVDNLMQTFQQQARMVGLTVESWTPSAEQKQDFYARLPVKVRATGTWTQVGEFFRRVSELDRIVSVEEVQLSKRSGSKGKPAEATVDLEITFEAATYRFLSDAERTAGATTTTRRRTAGRK